MADKNNSKDSGSKASSSDEAVTNPKFSEFDAPQVGGVSSAGADSEEGIFKSTTVVRDRQPDSSKGTPVKRFFTKDGTPVEPTTVPTGVTPSNLAAPQESMRDDVVAAWEYLDDGGNVVTHDSLKTKEEAKNRSNS